MKEWIVKYRNYICAVTALIFAAFGTMGIVLAREEALDVKIEEVQKDLAGEVFRFHVLANSDRKKDQDLKLKVRDAVIAYMKSEIPDSSSAKETKQWAMGHLSQIEDTARTVIEAEGFSYPVKASVSWYDFPEKTYGDMVFPAGRYEALRVEIGDAKGHNWWCVLYPDLCFTSAVRAVVTNDGKEELRSVLDEEEYEMITEPKKFKIKWFFFG